MRLKWRLIGVAVVLGIAGYAVYRLTAPTKVAALSVVCRPGDAPTEPVRFVYTAKVDPSVIERIPRAIDITLHYTGSSARQTPPITTYFYRNNGAALRVASSTPTEMPPNGGYTYHVDTGGYALALDASGRGKAEELAFIIEVDGNYFGGLLSPPTCGEYPDGRLTVGKATKVPDLNGRHPINLDASDWLNVSPLPTVLSRVEGKEVAMYAYFPGPIALTETKNETGVPDGPTKQAAEVGVTDATPTYSITRDPESDVDGARRKPMFDPGPGVQSLGEGPANVGQGVKQ